MEWRLKEFYDYPDTTDWMLVQRLIDRLVQRGYEVYNARYLTTPLDIVVWDKWPQDVVWKMKNVKFF